MEKIELIQARSFGEKLNELTALIYDNIGALLRQAWWLILGLGVILSLITEYFPTNTPAECWTCFLLIAFFCTLLIILFVTLIKVVGIEQQADVTRRDIFVKALVNGGRSLPSLLLPLALLCLFGGYFTTLIASIKNSGSISLIFLMLLIMLVIILAAAPLMQMINVCILEGQSGFAAMGRTFRLMRYKPIPALAFYFTIILLCAQIPTIVEIPYVIIRTGQNLVTDEYGFAPDPTFLEQLLDFGLSLLGSCAFILYICIASLASLLEYGNAVEVIDNVHFLEKFNNFDNL